MELEYCISEYYLSTVIKKEIIEFCGWQVWELIPSLSITRKVTLGKSLQFFESLLPWLISVSWWSDGVEKFPGGFQVQRNDPIIELPSFLILTCDLNSPMLWCFPRRGIISLYTLSLQIVCKHPENWGDIFFIILPLITEWLTQSRNSLWIYSFSDWLEMTYSKWAIESLVLSFGKVSRLETVWIA